MNMSRLCGWRALVRAADGDGVGAVDSLVTRARLRVAIDRDGGRWGQFPLSDLQLVLRRTRAPKEALRRLSQALVYADSEEDALKRALMQLRASYFLNNPDINPLKRSNRRDALDVVRRSWVTAKLNTALDTMAALIAAAEGPWPQQLDRVASAVPSSVASTKMVGISWSELATSDANRIAQSLATIRVERAAAAAEAYRRDHSEEAPASIDDLVPNYLEKAPLDPYSGRPLLIKRDDDGYSVYSIGADRTDNGGNVTTPPPPKGSSIPTMSAPDLGIRILFTPTNLKRSIS